MWNSLPKTFQSWVNGKTLVYGDIEFLLFFFLLFFLTKNTQRRVNKKENSGVLVRRQGNRSHSNKVPLDQVRESQCWLTAQQKENTHFPSPSCLVVERWRSERVQWGPHVKTDDPKNSWADFQQLHIFFLWPSQSCKSELKELSQWPVVVLQRNVPFGPPHWLQPNNKHLWNNW